MTPERCAHGSLRTWCGVCLGVDLEQAEKDKAETLELLRELEWDGRWCKGGGDSDPACPYCDGTQIDEGHKPGCKLAALLARFP